MGVGGRAGAGLWADQRTDGQHAALWVCVGLKWSSDGEQIPRERPYVILFEQGQNLKEEKTLKKKSPALCITTKSY